MNRTKQQNIARAISNGGDVADSVLRALEGETGSSTVRDYLKLYRVSKDGRPRFKIFAQGNGKLPFLAFSALPGAGFCPGAGDCLNFCYSFRSWRYPAAFGRQAQNAMLLQSEEGRRAILEALDTHKPTDGSAIDFRLYVDGDFSSMEILHFWMQALNERPWLRAYGYSKSFELFLAYDKYVNAWPTNYQLNLSSGHKYDSAMIEAMAELPITRGEFKAVNVGHKVRSSDHGTRDHNKALRAAYGRKAFTCPGKCGDCTPTGHACGSPKFKGVDIIIAVH